MSLPFMTISLSLTYVDTHGLGVHLQQGVCSISQGSTCFGKGHLQEGIYILQYPTTPHTPQQPPSTTPPATFYTKHQQLTPLATTLLWHKRLGHPGFSILQRMAHQQLAQGLPPSLPCPPTTEGPPCIPCVQGKHKCFPFLASTSRASSPAALFHLDICGPINPPARYF